MRAVRTWLAGVTDGAVAATAEWPSRRADGTLFTCEVTLSPIFDERGVHTHWLHVRRDLTQRHAAEAADRHRRELSGFASDLAARALGLGRDEILSDLDDVLGSFGSLLDADLVYLDMIDRAAQMVVPQSSWTSSECAGCDAAPPVIDLRMLQNWIAHLERTTSLSEWRSSDQRTEWMSELDTVFSNDSLDSHLYAPLHVAGQLIGVLGVASGEGGPPVVT